MGEGVDRLLEGTFVRRAEIVFGLVGAIGTELGDVEAALKASLGSVGYASSTLRVSELIHDIAEGKPEVDSPTELDRLMDEGDVLRRTVNHGGAAAALAVARVSSERREALGEDGGGDSPERESHATIIRQLKHPDEVRLLRYVYGPRFVLVGAWSPLEERSKAVEARLRTMHTGQRKEWFVSQVHHLLERDEKDARDPLGLGQRVRDTFELADAYLALLPGKSVRHACDRIVRLIFGDWFETPTREEQAMFQAWGARLRSSASGRQVGAVIVDDKGEMLVTGTNEAPKAGGGQYWGTDDPDHRDFQYGYDVNDRQKLELLTEVLQLLQDEKGWLADDRQASDARELARTALSGPLENARLGDLLEFGRIAHAEMAAICTAARVGTSIDHQEMYTTTYPCHQCARLIIAAGLTRVVYIDPYPKSQVPVMYQHEVVDGPSSGSDSVVFEPFQGIAPRLYASVFATPDGGRRRDAVTGEYIRWDAATATPRLVADLEGVSPLQRFEDSVSENLQHLLVGANWKIDAAEDGGDGDLTPPTSASDHDLEPEGQDGA